MKRFRALLFVVLLATFVGCENPEEPIFQETSSLTICYDLVSVNQGESMTKGGGNMDIFNEFYVAMKDGRLMAPSYNLTFTELTTGETFQLKGSWNKRESLKIKMGNYSVRGYSTAEGKYIQEKCSIIINDPDVVIDRDDTIIHLQASYDCALVIFADSSIYSVENQTGGESSEFFKFGDHYLYAFVNDSIWDGLSNSYLFCTRINGSEFSIPTNYQPFEKGKFYIYNTDKTSFFEIGVTLPEMEAVSYTHLTLPTMAVV